MWNDFPPGETTDRSHAVVEFLVQIGQLSFVGGTVDGMLADCSAKVIAML